MADVAFFSNKYTIDAMVSHYLQDIKKLRTLVKSPNDETKLQTYYQAASTFTRLNTTELYQFARSYGKDASGKSAAMREALPIVVGNRISTPTELDIAYLHLLVAYATAFKANRHNIKEWLLRFIVSSQFSPFYTLLDRELNTVISSAQNKIKSFQNSAQ